MRQFQITATITELHGGTIIKIESGVASANRKKKVQLRLSFNKTHIWSDWTVGISDTKGSRVYNVELEKVFGNIPTIPNINI